MSKRGGLNALTHEREITSQVLECTPEGLLNPEAVGFSRRPLHRCNLSGRWGRKKRWDYWCVTSEECAFSLTYADIDYLGLAVVQLMDFGARRLHEKVAVIPFARGFSQPETVCGGPVRFERRDIALALTPEGEGIRLQGRYEKAGERFEANVFVRRPAAHETLNVIIPWSEKQFQFTSKQNTLPASGWAELSGKRYEFSEKNNSYGCLDFGRGIWPFHTKWNWASASGRQGGALVGLQFGGKWTEGTGHTENGLCLNGRLHKIGEELLWDYDPQDFKKPWRIESRQTQSVKLRFEPFFERAAGVPATLIGGMTHQCFGRFSGAVRGEDGQAVEIRDLLGWAEEVELKW